MVALPWLCPEVMDGGQVRDTKCGMENCDMRHDGVANGGDRFNELQKDLCEDVQTAIHRNMEQFQVKFIIQQRELEEGLQRTMHHRGDHIIDVVISGPQDKILDPISCDYCSCIFLNFNWH